jgi:hypothetical protein
VTGDLQNEVAVPPLVKQAALSRSLYRQSTESERARRKSEVLAVAFAIQPDTLDRLDLAHLSLRRDQLGMRILQQRPDSFESFGSASSPLAGMYISAPP